MHHTTSGQTRRSALKELREWRDLNTEKKSYIRRKQQEEEARKQLYCPPYDEDRDPSL